MYGQHFSSSCYHQWVAWSELIKQIHNLFRFILLSTTTNKKMTTSGAILHQENENDNEINHPILPIVF